MSDTPPDRLSADPTSPFHDAALLERGIGIRFKGVEKNNVEEYCVSEGWVRVAVGTSLNRRGQPMTMNTRPSRTKRCSRKPHLASQPTRRVRISKPWNARSSRRNLAVTSPITG